MSGHSFRSRAFLMGNLKAWKEINNSPSGEKWFEGKVKVVGWLVGWLLGWLVAWLVGWLLGWLVAWLVGWLVVTYAGRWMFGFFGEEKWEA